MRVSANHVRSSPVKSAYVFLLPIILYSMGHTTSLVCYVYFQAYKYHYKLTVGSRIARYIYANKSFFFFSVES
jgi:hypothetical protein